VAAFREHLKLLQLGIFDEVYFLGKNVEFKQVSHSLPIGLPENRVLIPYVGGDLHICYWVRRVLGPTHFPIQWILGGTFAGR
jgi:hypothetical protein